MDIPAQDCEIDSSGIQSCLECGKEDPQWIIVKPGIGICPDCSGVHRSLSIEKPIGHVQAEAKTPQLLDPNIELPSSSDDVVPPVEPPPESTYDDYEEDYEIGYGGGDEGEEYVPRRRRRFLGEARIDMIAKHFWAPRPLRRDENLERVHRLFFNHLRSIPKHERVIFMQKIDGLCYDYFKNNRV